MHFLVQKCDEFQSYIFNIRPEKVVVYFFFSYDILLYLHEHSCVQIIWKLLNIVSIVSICNMEIPVLKRFVIIDILPIFCSMSMQLVYH